MLQALLLQSPRTCEPGHFKSPSWFPLFAKWGCYSLPKIEQLSVSPGRGALVNPQGQSWTKIPTTRDRQRLLGIPLFLKDIHAQYLLCTNTFGKTNVRAAGVHLYKVRVNLTLLRCHAAGLRSRAVGTWGWVRATSRTDVAPPVAIIDQWAAIGRSGGTCRWLRSSSGSHTSHLALGFKPYYPNEVSLS